MHSHAGDLRSELPNEYGEVEARHALVERVVEDWGAAGLTPVDRELCAYAEKLTRDPASMTAADLERLRALGLDDVALHDAVQVASFFNYINRIADGLHVALDEGMPDYPDGSRS